MSSIDVELFEREWEDDEVPHRRSERDKLSPERRESIASHDTGRIVGIHKGWLSVLYDGEVLDARYAGSMRGQEAVVGDRVRVRAPAHDTDVARILAVLDRDTVLTRTGDDADGDERVVVANADRALVVLDATHLEAGAGLVDRVMVAAGAGGLGTAVCVNKGDLVAPDDPEVQALVERYRPLGVPAVVTSATEGDGVDDLRELLADRWTVMAGHSAVGKSTLCNRLIPAADRDVAAPGRRGGRHTTVSTRALPLPGSDGWLVDTPGVRSFGLGVVDAAGLADQFPELAGLVCELPDCRHDGEPGCRVDEAGITPERLASYRRLLHALPERRRPHD